MTKLVISVLIRLSELYSKRQYSEKEEWEIYALRERYYLGQEVKKPVSRVKTRRIVAKAV